MEITRLWFLGGCLAMIVFAALPRTAWAAPSALPTVDIHTFGAVGDGTTVNTQVVQKAIDQCSAKNGAVLVFPAGSYVIGTIILKDNVHLRLETGATLLGNAEASDYHALEAFTDGTGQSLGFCLIGASGAKNIGIEGNGVIDGRGAAVTSRQMPGGPKVRPFLVRFVNCVKVTLSGVRLQNPAAWTLNFFRCGLCTVDGVTIRSHGQANNDGIDLDCCLSIDVKNCDIDSGDDALCLKATGPESCQFITVTNCTLKSNCAAIKFGTESLGDFREIRISDCKITGAGLGGIKLFSVDGSHLEDVVISDIDMKDVNVPIFLRLGARLKTFRPGDTAKTVGVLNNVTLRNIWATGTGIGILVSGIPGHPVEGLMLENISLHLPGGGTADSKPSVVPENEKAYPEITMFGTLPASGVYVRHADGVTLRHVTIDLKSPDTRPLIVSEDAANVTTEPALKEAP